MQQKDESVASCATLIRAALTQKRLLTLSSRRYSAAAASSTSLDGSSKLHVAAAVDDVEIIDELLKWSANASASALATMLSSTDEHGFTALHWAVARGRIKAAVALIDAGTPTSPFPVAGFSLLGLAIATGNSAMVRVLLRADPRQAAARAITSAPPMAAYVFASALGYHVLASELAAAAMTSALVTASGERGDGDLGKRPSDDWLVVPLELSTSDIEADGVDWHARVFTESQPTLVRGASDVAATMREWNWGDVRSAWGHEEVAVSFRPLSLAVPAAGNGEDIGTDYDGVDPKVQVEATESDETEGEITRPAREQMSVEDFIQLIPSHSRTELLAVAQSDVTDVELQGLPELPPHWETLSGGESRSSVRRQLWMCTEPKASALHFDARDSILLQLIGRKTFTLFDPRPLHSIALYPSRRRVIQLTRSGPGQYAWPLAADRGKERGAVSNRPLVNVTSPDHRRHPLFTRARPIRVELGPGDMLLLPAFWYHAVESTGEVNIALNWWFLPTSPTARLLSVLSSEVALDCDRRKRRRTRARGSHPCEVMHTHEGSV